LNSSSKVQVQVPLGAATGGAPCLHALPEADCGIVGADAPGALVVVLVVTRVLVTVVVDVVDGDERIVVVDGVVPPDAVVAGLVVVVVVVVVVLHAPRRCASGPHVEVSASV
jgi:hypothetical protein